MIMEYQKIIILLDDTTNQPFKFGIRNWVEINEKSRGTFNANGYIIFKNSVLRSIYVIIEIHTYMLKEL